ncbi:hypothetical protein CRE_18214 [Caenorhabditis remanei]|uniref:F-box domain-containing protein n=1 Tax=Caenorhabditis remanei TaxID=31234 RepID=E3NCI4_CAERE|nr:hypothetical protein CRE_18214 [Caenorhabditis remanei]
MQILRFPTLIQKEIFENLDFDELLVLSFLSKRCKQFIQTLQKNRFKKIKTIVYDFGWRDRISITVESVDSEYLLRLYFHRYDKSSLSPMKMFGITQDIR